MLFVRMFFLPVCNLSVDLRAMMNHVVTLKKSGFQCSFIHSFLLCMVMGCQKHSMTGFVYGSVRIIIRLLAWSSRDNFLSPVKYL